MGRLTQESHLYSKLDHITLREAITCLLDRVSFSRMPLLYGSIDGGRVLAVLFFICITLAGLSSLISILELCVHVLEDFGSNDKFLYILTAFIFFPVFEQFAAFLLRS